MGSIYCVFVDVSSWYLKEEDNLNHVTRLKLLLSNKGDALAWHGNVSETAVL